MPVRMPPTAALPQALQSITATKITELKKQRALFESRKSALLKEADSQTDLRERVRILLEGVTKIQGFPGDGLDTSDKDDAERDRHDSSCDGSTRSRYRNIRRFLFQSKYDSSISSGMLSSWEEELKRDLDLRSVKHEHALFFSQLVTEWLTNPNDSAAEKGTEGQSEHVGREEMHEQRAEWESLVFDPAQTDTAAIERYLEQLFAQTRLSQQALEDLRSSVKAFSKEMLADQKAFTPSSLKWITSGVISSDIFSPDKVVILKGFLENEDVAQEVADVLNMRLAQLDTWKWGSEVIPLEMRRQLNGKYRVYMDEDVLDALFLHYLGVQWGVKFKGIFGTFFNSHAWKRNAPPIPKRDLERRQYFLHENPKGDNDAQVNLYKTRRDTFESSYFMSQLPSTQGQTPTYDSYIDEDLSTSPIDRKHSLLHLLITEARVATTLYGKITVLRSDFKWFGPSLPHSTLLTVLKFFHMPQIWLNFFKTFLEAPVRFVNDGPDAPARIRRRGVPMSHSLSDFLGEVLLFCMDYSVSKSADGAFLYRLHDDFWFWGQEKLCVRAWGAMTEFSKVMGIEFNEEKTGTARLIGKNPLSSHQETSSSESEGVDEGGVDNMSITSSGSDINNNALPTGDVRWGFLKLDEEEGRFIIDQSKVDEHVKELKHQLDACRSIFSWIKAWNSYFARFFVNNFGKPAMCFGREHIEMAITTLQRIENELFMSPSNADASTPRTHNAVDYLRLVIAQRFNVHNLPDGVFYFPVELGGLELRNPLIPFLAIRENMRKTPEKTLEKAFIEDEKAYSAAKQRFEKHGPNHTGNFVLNTYRRRHGGRDGSSSPSYKAPETFMSLEEFNRYTETTSRNLVLAYQELLVCPKQIAVNWTPELMGEQTRLDDSPAENPPPIFSSWHSMNMYWKWIAELYCREMAKRYGGLAIVERGVVPLGVLKVLREGKVKWQS
ncbi:RT-like superfamily domain-containing protein [Histoplasma ohiense]|nr:RT-like superfamily domain-containing protein [Histoplasma ohiense (nom. inval.)]